jgi:hypothetical protein
VRTAADTAPASTFAAWTTWARAGIGRSPLAGYIAESVSVVYPGITTAFHDARRGNQV